MVSVRDFTSSVDWGDWAVDQELAEVDALKPGDEVKIGPNSFIVLESSDGLGLTKIIRKNLMPAAEFGNNNNWRESSLRRWLNDEYLEEIATFIGRENIVGMSRDLTSLDGLSDYDVCIDCVSLLTAREYAKYHEMLGLRSNYTDWWWLITPYSVPSNNYARRVCCVRVDGSLNWNVCDYRSGVRPFLTVVASALQS